MAKISVITPTVRPEGLPLVRKALNRQTFKDFEWVIVSPTEPDNVKFDLWLKDPGKNKGDVWSLNKAYNTAIKATDTPLVVSWQDWTFADHDILEKFWGHFEREPKTLIGAVGNKYEDETWSVMTWKDPRERGDQGSFYECYPVDWEANLASVPRQALYDIGGYDEYLDKFFSMDNISVVQRIDALGIYTFKIDQTIKSYSIEHNRPEDWDKKHAMHGEYDRRKRDLIQRGIWPILSYLSPDHVPSDI